MNKTRRRKLRARRLVSPSYHAIDLGMAINLPPGTVIFGHAGYSGYFNEQGYWVYSSTFQQRGAFKSSDNDTVERIMPIDDPAPQHTAEAVESGEYTIGDGDA